MLRSEKAWHAAFDSVSGKHIAVANDFRKSRSEGAIVCGSLVMSARSVMSGS
jgi:hypothetical protein